MCVKFGSSAFSFIYNAKHFKIHAVLSALKCMFFTAIKNNFYVENVKDIVNTLSDSDLNISNSPSLFYIDYPEKWLTGNCKHTYSHYNIIVVYGQWFSVLESSLFCKY